MSEEAPFRIVLAAEGPTDLRRISLLLDHFIRSRSDAQVPLDAIRQFERFDQEDYLPIKKIPELVREAGLPRYNPFGEGDKGTIRKLFQVLQKKKLLNARTVILWARDDDGDEARRIHATEARSELSATNGAKTILAIASQCGEAWLIAGFLPSTAADKKKITAWRKKIGFNPHEHPAKLSHKKNVPKSAKNIARDLFAGDEVRENEALIAAATSKGGAAAECGLRAFCDEVEAWLA